MNNSWPKGLGTALTVAVLGAFAVLYACSDNPSRPDGDGDGDSDTDTDVDSDADGGWDVDGDGPIVEEDGGVIIEEDGGTWTCHITSCDGHTLECGDCEDNDGDGVVDSHDPECLGPCDNTEGDVLLAGVGGETGGPCAADCYFDFGNGPGNDDCHWDHRCDELEVAPSFDPEGDRCEYDADRVGSRDCPETQSDQCLELCMPLTPNGCDCFGCCTFPQIDGRSAADGGAWVWIGSVVDGTNEGTCTFADVEDRTRCRPCSPVEECLNDCGPCELCLGRTELPPECFPDDPDGGPGDGGTTDGGTTDGGTTPPGARCPDGIQPCGLPGDDPCPENHYCITGCCMETIY